MLTTLVLASMLQVSCPAYGNPGVVAAWSGTMGDKPMACTLCTWIHDLTNPVPWLEVDGRCRIPTFGRKHRFGLTIGDVGNGGTLCRKLRRNRKIPAGCITFPPCVRPPSPGCCDLTATSPALFDASTQEVPTRIDGTFVCDDGRQGDFFLETTP